MTADIECCFINITEHGETSSKSYTTKCVIVEHIPISVSVGYMFNDESKYCFVLDCISYWATDLLTIETENNFKYNKQMIYTTEGQL